MLVQEWRLKGPIGKLDDALAVGGVSDLTKPSGPFQSCMERALVTGV